MLSWYIANFPSVFIFVLLSFRMLFCLSEYYSICSLSVCLSRSSSFVNNFASMDSLSKYVALYKFGLVSKHYRLWSIVYNYNYLFCIIFSNLAVSLINNKLLKLKQVIFIIIHCVKFFFLSVSFEDKAIFHVIQEIDR